MNTGHTSPRLTNSAESVGSALFGSERSTLEHAHSIARTIPFCVTQEEKRRRVVRLLSFAKECLK